MVVSSNYDKLHFPSPKPGTDLERDTRYNFEILIRDTYSTTILDTHYICRTYLFLYHQYYNVILGQNFGKIWENSIFGHTSDEHFWGKFVFRQTILGAKLRFSGK